MRVNLSLSAIVFGLLSAAGAFANADCLDTDKARTAYDLGERALQAHNVELAVSNFQEANRLCPNPNTQLAIATAYLLGQRANLARDALNRYISDAGATTDWCSVINVRRQVTLLDGGSEHQLNINVSPRSARVFVREASAIQPSGLPGCQVQPADDGLSVPLPAGGYTVTALLDAQSFRVVPVDLPRSDSLDITLIPPAAPAVPASGSEPPAPGIPPAPVARTRTWSERPENWIWIGAGAAGVVGAVTGIWALSLESDLDRACGPQHQCNDAVWADVDKHDRLATVSTIGLAFAVAGGAVGTAVYFGRARNKAQSGVSIVGGSISPGQLALNGRF